VQRVAAVVSSRCFSIGRNLVDGEVTATATHGGDLATSELAPCVPGGDRLFANGFDPPPPP